jgi:hypothetical protein
LIGNQRSSIKSIDAPKYTKRTQKEGEKTCENPTTPETQELPNQPTKNPNKPKDRNFYNIIKSQQIVSTSFLSNSKTLKTKWTS